MSYFYIDIIYSNYILYMQTYDFKYNTIIYIIHKTIIKRYRHDDLESESLLEFYGCLPPAGPSTQANIPLTVWFIFLWVFSM